MHGLMRLPITISSTALHHTANAAVAAYNHTAPLAGAAAVGYFMPELIHAYTSFMSTDSEKKGLKEWTWNRGLQIVDYALPVVIFAALPLTPMGLAVRVGMTIRGLQAVTQQAPGIFLWNRAKNILPNKVIGLIESAYQKQQKFFEKESLVQRIENCITYVKNLFIKPPIVKNSYYIKYDAIQCNLLKTLQNPPNGIYTIADKENEFSYLEQYNSHKTKTSTSRLSTTPWKGPNLGSLKKSAPRTFQAAYREPALHMPRSSKRAPMPLMGFGLCARPTFTPPAKAVRASLDALD